MNTHLILYNSHYGQTKKICNVIVAQMNRQKLVCDIKNIETTDKNFNLSYYQSILFAMPVYYGKHNKKMIAFINSKSSELKTKITGLFSINLTARKQNKNTPETNPYMKKLLQQLNFKPDHIGVMAGALKYPEYPWYDRFIIRIIMKMTKGPTNLHVSKEFTDWMQVEAFASHYIKKLLSTDKGNTPFSD